ncbi:MAG: F0F1 ATP synthase subunit epsilon [Pseudomonadota bacterium]
MADKLLFSLVSPAKELFSGEVDHVIAPGTDGEFGVLPNHAPFMSTLKNGVVRVINAGEEDRRVFVRGGFADITPEGFTILAEEATDLGDVDAAGVRESLQTAREDLAKLSSDDPKRGAAAEHVVYLEALSDALN